MRARGASLCAVNAQSAVKRRTYPRFAVGFQYAERMSGVPRCGGAYVRKLILHYVL